MDVENTDVQTYPRLSQHEPWLLPVISGMKGRTCIDVGANQGDWALDLAPYFETILAFEPHPGAYEVLAARTASVKAANVWAINKALGDEVGDVELNVYERSDHTSRYDQLDAFVGGEVKGKITAKVTTLDNILPQYMEGVDFVKVDTEGDEVKVLKGAKNFLTWTMTPWLIEVHTLANGRECIQLLEDAGYEVQPISHPNVQVGQGHYWIWAKKHGTPLS